MNLSRHSTNSIEWQEDYLDGQSLKNSIMRWTQNLFDPNEEEDEFVFQNLNEPGTAYEITINMVGNSPSMLGRYLGCVMIGFMPEDGLEETIFSLRDILEFYSHKPSPPPKSLAPKAIDATIG